MMPMEGMQQWPRDPRKPKPPAYVKMPGRPRKQRRREPSEAKKATKSTRVGSRGNCSKCHQPGHNSRTCGPKSKSKKRNIMEKGKEASNISYSFAIQLIIIQVLLTEFFVPVIGLQ